jgi:hypothetical protein
VFLPALIWGYLFVDDHLMAGFGYFFAVLYAGVTDQALDDGVDALQELRFAAKASGVEQQTLDTALQRFTRRAADSSRGLLPRDQVPCVARAGSARRPADVVRSRDRFPADDRGHQAAESSAGRDR